MAQTGTSPRVITEEELQAIEARAAGASEGPWRAERDQDDPTRCAGIFGSGGYNPIVKTDSGIYPPDWDTAKFIAAARGDVPDLVAEVRRLRAEKPLTSDHLRSAVLLERLACVEVLENAIRTSQELSSRPGAEPGGPALRQLLTLLVNSIRSRSP